MRLVLFSFLIIGIVSSALAEDCTKSKKYSQDFTATEDWGPGTPLPLACDRAELACSTERGDWLQARSDDCAERCADASCTLAGVAGGDPCDSEADEDSSPDEGSCTATGTGTYDCKCSIPSQDP